MDAKGSIINRDIICYLRLPIIYRRETTTNVSIEQSMKTKLECANPNKCGQMRVYADRWQSVTEKVALARAQSRLVIDDYS